MNLAKKTLTTSIIFGIATLILIVLLIFPLFRDIKKGSEDLVLVKKELISLQAKIENLERFKENYKALEPNLAKVDKLFVDPNVPVECIKFLEKTGQDLGVFIDISPFSIKQTKTDPWPTMGFQINLIGSFPDYLKFLEKTETAPYLIEIQNLSIRRLRTEELGLKNLKGLSLGDINSTFLIKVFTK
ncbi:hypothetical protein ACFL0A_01540 [Patescibacteria group bacterium]